MRPQWLDGAAESSGTDCLGQMRPSLFRLKGLIEPVGWTGSKIRSKKEEVINLVHLTKSFVMGFHFLYALNFVLLY